MGRCSLRDQDAAGSTTSLVTVTSITGIHKFKIRRGQKGLLPFVFQQLKAQQPEAEDLSWLPTALYGTAHVSSGQLMGLCPGAWSGLLHPLHHMEQWGWPSLGATPHYPHPSASEGLPHRCLHSDTGNTLPSALLGCGANPQPPSTGKQKQCSTTLNQAA